MKKDKTRNQEQKEKGIFVLPPPPFFPVMHFCPAEFSLEKSTQAWGGVGSGAGPYWEAQNACFCGAQGIDASFLKRKQKRVILAGEIQKFGGGE